MLTSLGALAVGALLGVRHAFEPDHLTAVTTLVIQARSARRGALLGMMWGLGHTASLLVLGAIVLVTGAALPARTAAGFELAVAVMLIVLGARAVWNGVRAPAHGREHVHRHHEVEHAHAGPAQHLHVAGRVVVWRPLVVGVVHGLAGTGALTALLFARLPDLAARMTYIALFGLGSVAGMAAATGLAGASLGRVVTRNRHRSVLAIVTGIGSIALGFVWALPQLAAL